MPQKPLCRHSFTSLIIVFGLLFNLILDFDGNHDARSLRFASKSGPSINSTGLSNMISPSTQCSAKDFIGHQKDLPLSSEPSVPLHTPHFGHGEFLSSNSYTYLLELDVQVTTLGSSLHEEYKRMGVAPPVPPPNLTALS